MLGAGVFFLLLYPLGIPLLTFLLLRFCRRRPSYEEAVSFLNCGYTDRYYYWEVIEMVTDVASRPNESKRRGERETFMFEVLL